jgi:predicted Rossmann fold nucleotide-binding protein DprA/Smf involved in DNA uptake
MTTNQKVAGSLVLPSALLQSLGSGLAEGIDEEAHRASLQDRVKNYWMKKKLQP